MAENPPDWAFTEAARICNKGNHSPLTVEQWRSHVSFNALAAKIAEHEEPPADPLADEAQELADQLSINLSAMPWVEGVLLTALRRGIEIERERSNA